MSAINALMMGDQVTEKDLLKSWPKIGGGGLPGIPSFVGPVNTRGLATKTRPRKQD